jgi:hypothetical protein
MTCRYKRRCWITLGMALAMYLVTAEARAWILLTKGDSEAFFCIEGTCAEYEGACTGDICADCHDVTDQGFFDSCPKEKVSTPQFTFDGPTGKLPTDLFVEAQGPWLVGVTFFSSGGEVVSHKVVPVISDRRGFSLTGLEHSSAASSFQVALRYLGKISEGNAPVPAPTLVRRTGDGEVPLQPSKVDWGALTAADESHPPVKIPPCPGPGRYPPDCYPCLGCEPCRDGSGDYCDKTGGALRPINFPAGGPPEGWVIKGGRLRSRRAGSGWTLLPSVGLAFSGLHDEHFSTRTVVVTPSQQERPAVTREEIVRQQSDSVSPEAAITFAFTKPEVKTALLVGIGLAEHGAGRAYVACGFKLGRTGLLSAGIALGSVKRISAGIDRTDAGEGDPDLARRDVLRLAPFLGLSFGLNNGS